MKDNEVNLDDIFNKVKEMETIKKVEVKNENVDIKVKELEVKEDNKTKTVLEKLENEFANFKKYNKSKDLEANYKAFFDSVHLLNVEERQNLLEYLEEAEPTDSIEKILMLGNDYRNLFETGLKTHKNLFAYVNDLHKQIDKLNEELSISRKNVDNSFDESDNKVIKTRYSANGSGIDNKTYNSFDKNLLNSLGILR